MAENTDFNSILWDLLMPVMADGQNFKNNLIDIAKTLQATDVSTDEETDSNTDEETDINTDAVEKLKQNFKIDLVRITETKNLSWPIYRKKDSIERVRLNATLLSIIKILSATNISSSEVVDKIQSVSVESGLHICLIIAFRYTPESYYTLLKSLTSTKKRILLKYAGCLGSPSEYGRCKFSDELEPSQDEKEELSMLLTDQRDLFINFGVKPNISKEIDLLRI